MTFLEFKRYILQYDIKTAIKYDVRRTWKLRIINRNKLNPFALGASQVEKPLTLGQFFTDNF